MPAGIKFCMIFCIFILIRNNVVYEEKLRLLKEVGALATKAITEGKDWRKYYQNFDKVSYYRMLWYAPFCFHWSIDEEGNII